MPAEEGDAAPIHPEPELREGFERAAQIAGRYMDDPDSGRLWTLVRSLAYLTDPSLSRLKLEDLLTDFQDRVRTVLAADTAVILLLAEGGDHLYAFASRGLEEEVEQRVTVPVGAGFAGRIAAQKQPVVLDRVDEQVVVNPLLIGRGLKAMLGVPLLAEGDVIGVLHVGSLTPRKFTDDELALLQVVGDRIAVAIQSSQRLQKTEQAIALRDEFLSLAAHELKTPITTLRGHAQLLERRAHSEEGVTSDQIVRAAAAMDRSTARLQILVEEMLEVARIEQGRLRLFRTNVDLARLVRDSLSSHFAEYRDRIELDADSPVPAFVDPVRAEQVVNNLMENAVRYAPEAPIHVSVVNSADGGALLCVRDFGPGISPQFRAGLFSRFQRGASERSGLGLGLYISKQIAELHGGDILVEFPPDGGSAFQVTFPGDRQ